MRKHRFDHFAPLDRGEVVLRVPCFGVELPQGRNFARLEGFEHDIGVAVEIEADAIEIMGALTERHIRAPIVGVTL